MDGITYLVGGGGFIGRHVHNALLGVIAADGGSGHVEVLEKRSTPWWDYDLGVTVGWSRIVNLAATVPGADHGDPVKAYGNDVAIAGWAARMADKYDMPLLHVSSVAATQAEQERLSELTYGGRKLAQEQTVERERPQADIWRLNNIWGPGGGGFYQAWLRSILGPQPLIIHGNGHQVRSWIPAGALATAVADWCKQSHLHSANRDEVRGVEASVLEFSEALSKWYGERPHTFMFDDTADPGPSAPYLAGGDWHPRTLSWG